MAGDPVNVRAPDRDVKGSPATPKFPLLHATRAANSGECHNPGMGTAPTGHNFTAWTHSASHPSGVPRRWRRRFLTGRHRQHCPMTAGSHLPGALVHRRPGRSPDRRRTRTAAGTRNRGKGRPLYAPSKSYWLAQRVVEVDHVLHHRSTLDRHLHHCHIVVTDGDSYRMKQARERETPEIT